MSPSCVPVIIGVGQVNDPGNSESFGPSVVALMRRALDIADADGGGGWLGKIDFLGIENQISSEIAPWPGEQPITPFLTDALNIAPSQTYLTPEPSGDGPVHLLDMAANRIASGEVKVAAIVGAEALRTAAQRAAAQKDSAATSNAMQALLDARVRPFLRKYGLVTPTDVYPLYESATRAAWRQSMDEAQSETLTMAAGYSQAATLNEAAAIRAPYGAEAIGEISERNRMITFPYTKLMVANSGVNQGAAVLVTSLQTARDMGVPENRIVYIGSGAAAAEDDDFLMRDSYAASPAMTASITSALERNAIAGGDLDCVELYNCFPCIPKMARRVLGWPLDRLPSVYGGLVFGGGPIGNCMMHAIVMMADKLRNGAKNGLIFANGGFATHNHTIVLTREADRVADRNPDYDVQHKADAMRGDIPPLVEDYTGPGRIEAYSVPYGRGGSPRFATVIGLGPEGQRFVCQVPREDEATLDSFVSGKTEPVGRAGEVRAQSDGVHRWSFA